MSQELLYTSAPHGLKPGSRGFCTVLSTQGMTAPLASALEGLSGYRPVFPPGDEQHDLNPITWSHVTMAVAGRTSHILSRVAEYGLDYSQRTNKLAHHVVLDSGELITAGPAALLRSSGFMRNEWNEEPHLTPTKPVPPIPPRPPGVCQAWKDLTGDGGWAGVLAESFLRDAERPVILLYAPGQDMLPLIAEAISLIPANRRWEVTFTTYFTGLPQTVNCNWRCMLHDSPEAHQSLRFVRALRFDLTNPESLGVASGNELVADARGVPRLKSGTQGSLPPLPTTGGADTTDPQPASAGDEYSLAEDLPPLPNSSLTNSGQRNTQPAKNMPRVLRASETATDVLLQRRKVAFTIAGLAAVLLLLVGLGVAFVISHRKSPAPLIADTHPPQPHRAVPPTPINGEPTSKLDSVKPNADEKLTKDQKKLLQTDLSKKSSISPDSALPEKPAREIVPDPTPPNNAKQPVHPQPQKDIKLPTGRKSVPFNKSPEGAITNLIEVEGETIPKCRITLFSPEITHLSIGQSIKNESKYSIVEEGNKSELGSIAWKTTKQEPGLLEERHSLNLTAGNGLNKFKRLEWCELDIEGNNDSPLTVILHRFPIDRKEFESSIGGTTPKHPLWGIQWKLKIETDESQMPPILTDGITITVGNQEFTFNSNGTPKRDLKRKLQSLPLTSEKFKDFIKKDLSWNANIRKSIDQVALDLSAAIDSSTEDTPGPVVIAVTLEGWDDLTGSLQELRKFIKSELEKYHKAVTAAMGAKGGKLTRSAHASKSDTVIEQVRDAVSEIEGLLKSVSESTDNQQVKDAKTKWLEGRKKEFNNYVQTENATENLQEMLKGMQIKSAKLFYQVKTSRGDVRRVQIFTNQ